MDQDKSYPVHESQYGLDPAYTSDSQWPIYHSQIAQHSEQFAVPHNTLSNTATPQTYQPYTTSQLPYNSYGTAQEPMYPASSFPGDYAPSYQSSNLLHSYGTPQHGVAQAHPAGQQPFSNPNQPYPYTQAFRTDDRTISPQILERVDDNPQQHRSLQAWEHGIVPGYEHQSVINSAEPFNQQSSSTVDARAYNTPTFGSVGNSGSQVGVSSQVRDVPRSVPSRRATTILPQSTLRITHPELLSATENIPSRRIKSAPFIVLDEEPILLDSDMKMKTPVSKAVRDNKRLLETGSENSSASIDPSTNSTKVRSRPIKSGPHIGLANSASRPKSLPSAGNVSPQTASSSDEESDSGDDSNTDERPTTTDIPQQITDLRPEMRPADVVEAAAWDAIGAIFSPSNRNTTTDEIIKGTQEFGKLFLELRDKLVSISAELAGAEADKRLEDIERLRDARTLKRKVITSAVQTAIKFGKAAILNNFGKSPKLINGFIHVLRDCIKSKDLDGELPKALLDLLSRCGFITDELLQKAKFEPLEKRLVSNNDAKIKEYIKKIRANTVDAKERAKSAELASKAADNKARGVTQDALKVQKAVEISKPLPSSLGLKRAIDTDSTSGKPNKKVASETTGVGSGQRPVASKPRAPGFFDYRKNAAPKPTVATKAHNPPAPTSASVKKRDSMPEPTQTPQSSLQDILDSINKGQVDVPQAPVEPPRPPETAEEKARRERKESRRHLRVQWKEDNALTEIRLFKHEQAEDEGRQENMLLDAHDGRSEGMMFKNRVLETMADEEDDGAAEVEYMPYSDLKLIDFSVLDDAVREKSYISRGGKLLPNSPQMQIQDRRESLELMVVYTDPKDIPPSPREPSLAPQEGPSAERAFGQSTAPWLFQRIQEIYQYGPTVALSGFVRKFEREKGRAIYQDTTLGENTPPDISSILNLMRGLPEDQNLIEHNILHQSQIAGHKTPNQKFIQPFQDPNLLKSKFSGISEENMKRANEILANLARMTDELRGKPHPPTKPPGWMTDRAKFEWWEGFHRDNRRGPGFEAVQSETLAHQAHLRLSEAQKAQIANFQTATPVPAPQMQSTQLGSYSAPPPPPTHLQPTQLGSFPVPQPPSVATAAVPSYDIGKLQQVLASLNNGGNNTMPSQLQDIFSSLNGPNSQALAQQQQNWSGGWPGASGGNGSTQLYPSQVQPTRWGNTYPNAADNSRSAYNENSRSSYDTINQDHANQRATDGVYGNEERQRVPVPTAASEYKGKKKPCKFWQEGKCAKGANCTFLHD